MLIVVWYVFSSNDSSDKETTKVKTSSEENAEVKSLEDVGGYENWKNDGFPGKVYTDITVGLPVTQREVNTYCVLIGALEQTPILIMQEDESPAQNWEWLMNAQPLEDGGDEAYFKVTLQYVGQSTDEDDLPVFIVSDIESY